MATTRSKTFSFLVFLLALSAMITVGVFFFSLPRFGGLTHTNNVIQAASELHRETENAIRYIDNPDTTPAELKVRLAAVPIVADGLLQNKPISDEEKKLEQRAVNIRAAVGSIIAALDKLSDNADPAVVQAAKADARRPLAELKGYVIEIAGEEAYLMGRQTGAISTWTFITMAMLCVTGFFGAMVAFMGVRAQQAAADAAARAVPAPAPAPAAAPVARPVVDEARQREIELVPAGMMVYGPDGRLRYGNAAALRMLGLRHEDVVAGRADTNLITLENTDGTPIAPSDRPSARALHRSEIVTDHELRATAPWLKEPVYLSVSALPLKDRAGAVDSALVVIQDITARTLADRERDNLQNELVESRRLETVANLAGGIGHDFGNALLAIDGSADAVAAAARAGNPIDEPQAHLKQAIASARDLAQALSAYNPSADTARSPVDLNAFLPAAARHIARLLPSNFPIDVRTAAAPVYTLANAGQLQQLLSILAMSARDAMGDGGPIHFTVDADRSTLPAQAVLRISDGGSATAEELRQRLLPASASKGATRAPGTVQRIIQDHGGSVSVESDPSRGGIIVIRLPLTATPPTPAPAPAPVKAPAKAPTPLLVAAPAMVPAPVAPVSTPAPSAPTPTGPETSPPGAVMVIQSDDRVRPLVVQTLRNSGYYVEAFTDAESAYEVFRSQPKRWNVLVIDLNLVGLDGSSALRRMRRLRPGQPALILAEDEIDAGKDQIDSTTRVLLKPFTMHAMRTTIADLMFAAV